MTAPDAPLLPRPRCCGCGSPELTRRELLKAGAVTAGGLALAGCAWSSLRTAAAEADAAATARTPIVVKPILSYDLPRRRPQTSWRSWGGIHTEEAAKEELARIQGEIDKVKAAADFPVTFLPPSQVRSPADLANLPDAAGADVLLHYAAGGGQGILDAAAKSGKHVIFFLRHRSGPVSLWYEIVSPRYLRQHTDSLSVKGVDNGDVVVDSLEDLSWRLRALVGVKNTVGSRIVAVGGPGGWATPKAPDLAREKFKLDIQTLTYPELAALIKAAREDAAAVNLARKRAADYLRGDGVRLETEKVFVENCFLLDQVFRALMAKADARAITVHHCMGTIMPVAETTACLTLTTLNDTGYLAFCESDFVAIPAGLLLGNITGRPPFLNNPTFPHAGVMTQAHCTAPRKMDGKSLDPVRIVTHMESDYGAAPKVELRRGQAVTNVITDFAMQRWSGYAGEIADTPFLPICRSQMDVAYCIPDQRLVENMRGFHFMTVYGDYRREAGYAVKKIGIAWENLG
ncbi:MAG: sugar isomerase [Planctomycetes bacterium]|nr:sugar isomerase [Planctomycetota bacterium]